MSTDTAPAEADVDPDHGEPAGRPSPAGRRSAGRRLGGVVAALIVVASVTGAAWTGVQVRDERSADERERSALAAGRDAAVAFTSYDHRRIDEDLDRIAAMSTGDFREEFSTALGALTGAIRKARGVSTGDVAAAGVIRHTADTAVVIAAVDATITNIETERPSLRRYRLQITLTLVDGDWLISDIGPVA